MQIALHQGHELILKTYNWYVKLDSECTHVAFSLNKIWNEFVVQTFEDEKIKKMAHMLIEQNI